MFDAGRNVNKAGFGDGRLHAIDDEIDLRSQIGRIVHIAADKATDLIVIRMRVFGERSRDGAHDPTGFHVKGSLGQSYRPCRSRA